MFFFESLSFMLKKGDEEDNEKFHIQTMYVAEWRKSLEFLLQIETESVLSMC